LRRLLAEDSSYAVIFCEADEYVDLNDAVEYTEVFLAVIQQLTKDAQPRGVKLAPGRLQSFLTDLRDILSAPVEAKDAKAKFGLVEIGFEIKRNPNYRQQVREYLRPRAADFLQAVNEVIEKAARRFKEKDANCAGLVVIVDNLDRLLRQLLPNTNRFSDDELFVHNASQLSIGLSRNLHPAADTYSLAQWRPTPGALWRDAVWVADDPSLQTQRRGG
jgi:hypothetical protein